MREPRLVGRERAVSVLDDLVAGLGRGLGATVGISGAAGVGRTALLRRVLGAAPGASASCVPDGVPFGAVTQLASALVPPADFGDLVGACLADPERAAGLLCDAFVGLARERALVLAVDDLQWADEWSLRWFTEMAGRTAPVLLIATAYEPVAVGQRIEVGPLGPAETTTLVRQLLGELPAEVEAAVLAVVRGRPAVLHDLAATHGPTPAEWTPARVAAAGREVVSVRAARIRHGLPPGALALVRAMSVSERLDVVAAVGLAELPAADVPGALSALEASGLVADGRPAEPHLAADVLAELAEPERDGLYRRGAELAHRSGAGALVAAELLRAAPPVGEPWARAVLEEAAEQWSAQGNPVAAADSLRRALAEPASASDRAALLVRLASAVVRREPDHADRRLVQVLAEPALATLPAATTAADLLLARGDAETVHRLVAEPGRASTVDPALVALGRLAREEAAADPEMPVPPLPGPDAIDGDAGQNPAPTAPAPDPATLDRDTSENHTTAPAPDPAAFRGSTPVPEPHALRGSAGQNHTTTPAPDPHALDRDTNENRITAPAPDPHALDRDTSENHTTAPAPAPDPHAFRGSAGQNHTTAPAPDPHALSRDASEDRIRFGRPARTPSAPPAIGTPPARALPPFPRAQDPASAGVTAFRLAVRGEQRGAVLDLAAQALVVREEAPLMPRIAACRALVCAGALADATDALTVVIAAARRRDARAAAARALVHRAAAVLRDDRPEEALRDLAAADRELPVRCWHPLAMPARSAVEITAQLRLGRLEHARHLAAEPLPRGSEHGAATAFLRHAEAELALAEDDPGTALHAALECGRVLRSRGWVNPMVAAWRTTASLALRRLGDHGAAAALAAEELALAERWGTAAALEPLRERASAGLRRTVPAPRRPADPLPAPRFPARRPDALSPAERDVAELAARGLANREIARELSIALRTVELRLTKVYRKLGLKGRAALADHWPTRTPGS
ncbi:LuxR C-terminal-related transcriptional regulator [Amycolatopsis sp. FBCC-B4732]|uniref:helix-turn-helix transcriptional regulator n=1 Tax=Amycolatopsis sp. FBCC-B4732 TaxID=3079339 RepID=UPI001FF233CD|nr:AAA family ATPase [Amycolatopsis sp. FBCC-B4732]UOX92931.1 LuxR C-terminal-related transcriptional regulator [Amycolatopsis sp. FBCC-B4732]